MKKTYIELQLDNPEQEKKHNNLEVMSGGKN